MSAPSYLFALTFWAGLTLGNFVWQILDGRHNWGAAIERSFFQFVALIVFVAILRAGAR